MSTKQLYEKTSEGMKEVSPLVAIEDIYSKISDTPLEALVSLYNHVKCEWKGSVADTRRTVPLFLRRSGLFITYNNGTKYITEFFSAGTDQITTEGWVKDSNWTPVPDEDYISAGVKPGFGTIGYEQLSDNLKQLFREKVNVTNLSDDEDIASVDNMLKFKDREADIANFQSKGYVILRKNLCLVNGVVKNILTQNMINRPNTIYEIRYDFDLDGKNIEIQEGTVLKFEGGILRNGKINAFKIYLEKCSKENFHNVEFIGIPYIDNKECTTKLDVVDRNILFQASVPFTSSIQDIINCVEPARYLGINHFQYVPDNNTDANKQIEFIDTLKLYLSSVKIHTVYSANFMEWFEKTVIPIIQKYSKHIEYVYINNEAPDVVQDPTICDTLISCVNKIHGINTDIKVGVSTNYSPSLISKSLYDALDCIGINYYPKFPYVKEKTRLDSFIKEHAMNYFKAFQETYLDKEITITEFGCIPFYECAFNPADWQLVNKFDKINYDIDLIYTKCFYDLGFYLTNTLGIKYLNIWYNETLGKYSRYYPYINQSAFKKLYNHWLKI